MYKVAAETDIQFLILFYETILSLYPSHKYDSLKDEQKAAINDLQEWIPKLIGDLNKVYNGIDEVKELEGPANAAETVLVQAFKTLNLKESDEADRQVICETQESLRTIFKNCREKREECYRKKSEAQEIAGEAHIILPSDVEKSLKEAKTKFESFDDRSWYRSFLDGCVSIRKSDVFAISSVAAGVLYYAFKLGVLAGVSFASFGIGVAVAIGVAIIWQIFKYPTKRFAAKIAKLLTGNDPGWGKSISKTTELTRALNSSKQNNKRLQDHNSLLERDRSTSPQPVNAEQDKMIAKQAKTIAKQAKTIAEQAKTIAEQRFSEPRSSSQLSAKDREIEELKLINENQRSLNAQLEVRGNQLTAIVQTFARAAETGGKARVIEIVRKLDAPNAVHKTARRPLSSGIFNLTPTQAALVGGKAASCFDNPGANESKAR